MTSLDLARWQFGLTTLLHFAIVGVSIGLVFFVALLQTRYHRTGEERWLRLTKYYGRAMVIVFAVGVVTGLMQTFQFGMNWAGFSRYVGDVFGAPLALEGLGGVLRRVRVPRAVDLRRGQAAAAASTSRACGC